MKNIVIGVDNGNYNTKTVNHVYTSGVISSLYEPSIADEKILFNGMFYTLTNNRKPYHKDKTKDLDSFVLTLFAIAKELKVRGEVDGVYNIDLAVGLPPGDFVLKDKFKDYFLEHGKDAEFVYNGISYLINIVSVTVYPQAFSMVVDKIGSLKQYSRYYVVDIGGYTTDVLILEKGKILSYKTVDMGIIRMNESIRNTIQNQFGESLEEFHIQDVIQGNQTLIPDEFSRVIINEANLYVKSLLDGLYEIGYNFRLNPSLFGGGGSIILEDAIRNYEGMSSHIEFIGDIRANAIGYEKLQRLSQRK